MNNTRDIYNNILDNLVKFYGPHSLNVIGRPRTAKSTADDPIFSSIFSSPEYQGEKWTKDYGWKKCSIINRIIYQY